MPIEDLEDFDIRDFDAAGIGIGHAAGAQFPAGAGRSLPERVKELFTKTTEVIDEVNGLPLTASVLATATELTIATGAITMTRNLHTVDTEADAPSDDLDSIAGGEVGQILFLRPVNDGRTVVVKHSASIVCPYGQDITLAEDDDYVFLIKFDADTWVVLASKLTAAAGGLLGKVLGLTTNGNGASLIGIEDAAALITATTVEAALLEHQNRLPTNAIADPGNAGAIPVTRSGSVALTTAGAGETRTLAIPSFKGQQLDIYIDTDGGGVVITVAQAINVAGNTTITMNEVRDFIRLVGVTVGGALRWEVVANLNCVLG